MHDAWLKVQDVHPASTAWTLRQSAGVPAQANLQWM